MRRKEVPCGALLLLFFLPCSSALAEQPPTSVPALERASREHGEGRALTIKATYILDLLSNVRGGVERGTKTLGNLNLVFDYETPWDGNFHAYLLANHGGSFSARVGDFQTLSNIEAPATVHPYEAYYQHRFFDDRLSLLAGLYAVDSEFDTRTSSDLFLHSSPGTGGELAQVGVNGPGIYPFGALALRLKYEEAGWYGQVALTEGSPRTPGNPFRTRLSFDGGEGILVLGEAGHVWSDEHGELGKVGLGAWGFSHGYKTFLDPEAEATNRGGYLSLEKRFTREEDPKQGLSGYLRVGVADGRINPIETFVGAGLVYTGLFEGRDHDRLGVAINTGFAGQEFLRSGNFERHETAVELTYSFAISDSFSIQPDLQYIINPGFDAALEDSLVVGLRAVFSLGN